MIEGGADEAGQQLFVLNVDFLLFVGENGDDGGVDAGDGIEGGAGDVKKLFDLTVSCAGECDCSVLGGARLCTETVGDLLLYHEGKVLEFYAAFEQVQDYGGGDVIGEIGAYGDGAVAEFLPAESCDVGLHSVGENDLDVIKVGERCFKQGLKGGVYLYRHYLRTDLGKLSRHGSDARSDLQGAGALCGLRYHSGNSGIDEKILSELLFEAEAVFLAQCFYGGYFGKFHNNLQMPLKA